MSRLRQAKGALPIIDRSHPDYAGRYPTRLLDICGTTVTIVCPVPSVGVAPGRPWIWRAAFLGQFDSADRMMLDAGWHLVQVETPSRYGDATSMAAWENAYGALVERSFHPRPGLIALSRGCVYAVSWAASHPDTVSAIYLDNPVCDLRSWPGGRPQGFGRGVGALEEWRKLLQAFSIGSDEPLDAVVAHSPISKLAAPASADIPLLVVYGDADEIVPAEENAELLAARYAALGGRVTQIVKPGCGHHPHGLDGTAEGPEFARTFFENALCVSRHNGKPSSRPGEDRWYGIRDHAEPNS